MKTHVKILVAILLLGVATGIFVYVHFSHKPVKNEGNFLDSIRTHADRAESAHDSVELYQKVYKKALDTYNGNGIDTAEWSRLRTSYRSGLRDQIRTELARQRDSLRAVETSHFFPPKGQSAP